MRILKIELQNLNSLSGKHGVDFTAYPLSGVGIIAVTGETGSGKSTILDAILLALYAKTARDHQKEVVTHGQTDAWSEVEYEVFGVIYRSRWEVKLRRSGKEAGVQASPHMSIYKQGDDGGWELHKTGITEVSNSIEQIIGLSYDQFCQSVILPQGKVSKFISAKVSERSAILEHLTNTEIYGKLSTAAYERSAEAKHVLNALNEKMQLLKIPTKAEIELWKEEQTAAGKRLTGISKEKRLLEDDKKWFQIEKDTESKIADYQSKLSEIDIKWADFEPNLKSIESYDLALPFLDRYKTCQSQNEEITETIKSLENCANKKISLTKEVTTHTEAIETHRKQLDLQRIAYEGFLGVAKQVNALDEQQRRDESHVLPLESELSGLQKEQNSLFDLVQSGAKTIETLEAKLAAISQWFVENAHLGTLEQDFPLISLHTQQLQALEASHAQQHDTSQRIESDLKIQQPLLAALLKNQSEDQEKISLFTEKLNQILQSANVDPLTINTKIEELRAALIAYTTIKQQQERYLGTLADMSDLRDKNAHLLVREEMIYLDLFSLLDEQDELKSVLSVRKGIQKTQERTLFVEKERKNLVAGEPCPVCGALEHPEAHHLIDQLLLAEQDTLAVQHKLEALQPRMIELQKEALSIHNQIGQVIQDGEEMAHLNFSVLVQKSIAEEHKLGELITNLPKNSTDAKHTLKEWKFDTAAHTDLTLEEIKTELDQLILIKNQMEDCNLQIGKTKEDLTHTLLEVHQAEQVCQRLKLEQLNLVSQEKGIKKEILDKKSLLLDKFTYYKMKTEESSQQILEALTKQKENWSKATLINTETESSLLETRVTYQSNIAQKNTTEQKIAAKAQNLSAYTNNLNETKAKRLALFGDKDVAKEQNQQEEAETKIRELLENTQIQLNQASQLLAKEQGTLSQLQIDLTAKTTKYDADLMQLGQDMHQAGFTDAATLKRQLITSEQRDQLLQQKIDLEQSKHTLQTQVTESTKALTIHKKTTPATPKIELEGKWGALEEEEKTLLQTQGSLNQKFSDLNNLNDKSRNLQQEIELASREYTRWDRLNQVIGSKGGDKFRQFAQAITHDNLIYHANKHLRRLYGRYSIMSVIREKEVDMKIVDQYQSDHQRSISSLSGGETFLISLAMALGLSDLAGQKTRIQSVFIDEGFGSLDTNTLDTAMKALENLQAEGVTIGIISHVRELQERIGTKITIKKVGNGMSVLEVTG
jgi:DNA repair protein SbcC/Rad50